jgi:hypothetical protein
VASGVARGSEPGGEVVSTPAVTPKISHKATRTAQIWQGSPEEGSEGEQADIPAPRSANRWRSPWTAGWLAVERGSAAARGAADERRGEFGIGEFLDRSFQLKASRRRPQRSDYSSLRACVPLTCQPAVENSIWAQHEI